MTSGPDLCIAVIDRAQLVRWPSAAALLHHVGDGPIYVRPIIRERRDATGAVYRCLVLFREAGDPRRPRAMTLDVTDSTLRALDKLELDTDAGRAVVDLFALLLHVIDVTPHDA